jgi:hypothetical protein
MKWVADQLAAPIEPAAEPLGVATLAVIRASLLCLC